MKLANKYQKMIKEGTKIKKQFGYWSDEIKEYNHKLLANGLNLEKFNTINSRIRNS